MSMAGENSGVFGRKYLTIASRILSGIGKFCEVGKFSPYEITHSVGLYGNLVLHCHLSVVVQTTRRSNGASAESCIKFENFLLVRVDLSWTEDVCIG
jgi:hypothetical protein